MISEIEIGQGFFLVCWQASSTYFKLHGFHGVYDIRYKTKDLYDKKIAWKNV